MPAGAAQSQGVPTAEEPGGARQGGSADGCRRRSCSAESAAEDPGGLRLRCGGTPSPVSREVYAPASKRTAPGQRR
eukprot:10379969-Lingulodinium_polyedra.AAC.1